MENKKLKKEILNIINNCYSKTSFYHPNKEFFIYDEKLIREIKLAKINNDKNKIKFKPDNINILYEVCTISKHIWISWKLIEIIKDKIQEDSINITLTVKDLFHEIYSTKYEIVMFIEYEKEMLEKIKQSMNYNIHWNNVYIY